MEFFFSNEGLWLILLVANFLVIITLYIVFGETGVYVWVPIAAIIANIQVLKTIELFGLTATLGNIVYAGSFLATDILSENHGKRSASRGVAFGFVGILAVTLFMNLALLFEPAESDFAHSALTEIFSLLPRITAASLAAYLVSQAHDIWAYEFWKRRFPSRKLIWVRNNLSTLVSQLIDSLVFTLGAFWGVFSGSVLFEIVFTTYLLKLIVAVADTPFVYIASFSHRAREKRAATGAGDDGAVAQPGDGAGEAGGEESSLASEEPRSSGEERES